MFKKVLGHPVVHFAASGPFIVSQVYIRKGIHWAASDINTHPKTASNYIDAFDLLLDAYKDIGNSLPQFGKYAQLFGDKPSVRKVLVDVFEGILTFHKKAMGFFRRSGLSLPSSCVAGLFGVTIQNAWACPRRILEVYWDIQGSYIINILCAQAWKILFRASWDGFREPFSNILTELKKRQTILEKEGNLANFENVDLMRKDLAQNRGQQFYWRLSPADCGADHSHMLSLRSGFPDTCKWLFQKKDLILWQDTNSDVYVFWLHGILGSGTYYFM